MIGIKLAIQLIAIALLATILVAEFYELYEGENPDEARVAKGKGRGQHREETQVVRFEARVDGRERSFEVELDRQLVLGAAQMEAAQAAQILSFGVQAGSFI